MWFAFRRVFRMSRTYKVQKTVFDSNFHPNRPEKISCFKCKQFCNKTFSKLFVWIMKFASYLSFGSFYSKNSKLNILKREKSFIMQKQTLEVFSKNRSSKNFTKPAEKQLFWSHLFFNKVAGPQGLTPAQLFSCKIFLWNMRNF